MAPATRGGGGLVAYLQRLHLRNFRNFAEQTLEFPPEGVALIGPNGQGKTNLLEAIYYLEIFRSFRGAPDEQLVRFGEDVFRVEGRVAGTDRDEHPVAAAFQRRGKRKKVSVGGAEPERFADAIGGVGVTIFSPSDVGVVAGSPGERRRFLDILLSLAVPGYLAALQRFRQALFQRNTLLRQGAPASLAAAWNDGLALAGSRVIAARAQWVREHADTFAERYAEIAGGQPALLGYEASFPLHAGAVDGLPALTAAFHGELARVGEREQRRGMTLVGPHRDDLRFTLQNEAGPLDLRTYGSGGQQRTAAIALRMVEANTIRASRGRDPIILLDDAFAELDADRSARILAWIEQEPGQVILTSPKASDIEVRGGALPRWTIHQGEIAPA